MAAQRVFKFRLHSSEKQEQKMFNNVEICRRLWDTALGDRKRGWEEERLSTTYGQQRLMLTAEVQANPALRELYSQVLQDVLNRLDKAFKAFFRGNSRYPRFKKYREFGSFTYPQAYNGSVKFDPERKRIFLSKIGNMRVVAHRQIPPGKLKTCTVVREPDRKWYVCLVYGEVAPLERDGLRESWKSPVGIDLGLKSLITTSDAERIKPSKFLKKAEEKLKHLQQNLSNKREHSKNWMKARQRLAVQHARVANQRRDINHKLSASLVRSHDLIVFEHLSIKNMVRNHALAKSIMDAGWNTLVTFTDYKARKAGGLSVKVPAAYTTQGCYFCGAINQLSLDTREFECRGCNKVLDRDINAARVVLMRGIAKVGQDKVPRGPRIGEENPPQTVPELKPVETGPLPPPTTGAASQVSEAGTRRGWNLRSTNPAAGSPQSSVVGGCHMNIAEPTQNCAESFSSRNNNIAT